MLVANFNMDYYNSPKISKAEYDLSHEMYLRHQKKEPEALKFVLFLGFCAIIAAIAILI